MGPHIAQFNVFVGTMYDLIMVHTLYIRIPGSQPTVMTVVVGSRCDLIMVQTLYIGSP